MDEGPKILYGMLAVVFSIVGIIYFLVMWTDTSHINDCSNRGKLLGVKTVYVDSKCNILQDKKLIPVECFGYYKE